MYLVHARLIGVPPFSEVAFPFCDPHHGQPRLVTVVHGGGGVGKTSLLHALVNTRPGHSAPLGLPGMPSGRSHAVCHWSLSCDEPSRPHPLVIATPNVRLDEDEELGLLRRREQTMYDRKAREGGFVFLAISSARWFSRQPVMLNAPQRTIAQYDVRAAMPLDDASRSDLTRETKQALAYAGLSAALTHRSARVEGASSPPVDTRLLGHAMHEMCDALVSLVGYHYEGLDPISLEPTFSDVDGRHVTFDVLPQRARHLVSFAALPIRMLWAAYPGRDPRLCEGVVAIDEVDLHQDQGVQERLVGTLRRCLPCVQWIVTTSSPTLAAACDASSVLALRRMPKDEHVEVFVGEHALTH